MFWEKWKSWTDLVVSLPTTTFQDYIKRKLTVSRRKANFETLEKLSWLLKKQQLTSWETGTFEAKFLTSALFWQMLEEAKITVTTISFPEAAIPLVSTKSRDLLEMGRRASISQSGYSIYACSVLNACPQSNPNQDFLVVVFYIIQSVEHWVTTDLKRTGSGDKIAYWSCKDSARNGKSTTMYAAFADSDNFIAQKQSNGLSTQLAKLQATKNWGTGKWKLITSRFLHWL